MIRVIEMSEVPEMTGVTMGMTGIARDSAGRWEMNGVSHCQ